MSFFHKYNPYHQVVPETRLARIKRYWTELIFWKKIIAVLLIVSLLGISLPIRAYFTRGERYIPYSESLQRQKIVDLDYRASDLTDLVPTEEAIRIAINVGGGLDFDCE
jgi:hypothetical protein